MLCWKKWKKKSSFIIEKSRATSTTILEGHPAWDWMGYNPNGAFARLTVFVGRANDIMSVGRELGRLLPAGKVSDS